MPTLPERAATAWAHVHNSLIALRHTAVIAVVVVVGYVVWQARAAIMQSQAAGGAGGSMRPLIMRAVVRLASTHARPRAAISCAPQRPETAASWWPKFTVGG